MGRAVYAVDPITWIANIGSGTVKDSSSSPQDLLITTTAAVAAGDDIIIAYATDPTQDLTITVSDSAGNKYQQAAMAISVGSMRTYIFAAYNVTALPSGSTITIHQTVFSSTAAAARAAVVSVFRGLAPVGALEQTCVGSGTSTTPSSGAATTIQADQLLIGAVEPKAQEVTPPGRGITRSPPDHVQAQPPRLLMRKLLCPWAGGLFHPQAHTLPENGITSRDWATAIATFKTTDAGISYIGDIGSAQTKASSRHKSGSHDQ